MTVHTEQSEIGYVATDLDNFAATLADLASAITQREPAAAWSAVFEIRAHDHDLSAALADYLSFTGLTCKEATP
ncbi:hypothetical protein ACTMTJ_31660 [Phytohabitans sp. LJ34]|uniref:hypothetical protein n=1 Tax=Phytohabitans sp. LJ34 TaxID=3452217 RepID=UPI003F8A3554